MSSSINLSAAHAASITKDLKGADTAVGTALGKIQRVAETLAGYKDPAASPADNAAVLFGLAMDALKASKVTLKQERNIRLMLRQSLLIALKPDAAVEFDDKRKGVTTIKPAADCKTARERAEAAKQIRQSEGLADGRSKNGKGARTKKAEPAPQSSPVWAELSRIAKEGGAERDRLVNLLRSAGWKVTPPKK